MISIENMLLISTGVSSVILIVLLFLSGRKNHKPQRRVMSKEMRKIKDEISEDTE